MAPAAKKAKLEAASSSQKASFKKVLLNEDVLVDIFKYLQPGDLVSMRCISRAFKFVADNSWKKLVSVDFKSIISEKTSNESARKVHEIVIQRCRGNLTEIRALGYRVSLGLEDPWDLSNWNVELIKSSAVNLTHLQFTGETSTYFVQILPSFAHLRCLEWEKLDLKEGGEAFDSILLSLTNLKKLVLIEARLVDSCKLSVPHLIREIHLFHCCYVYKEASTQTLNSYFPLSILNQTYTSLEVLNIPGMNQKKKKRGSDDGDGLDPIPLKNFTSLKLDDFAKAFPNLVYLDLSHFGFRDFSSYRGWGNPSFLLRVNSEHHFKCIQEMHLNSWPDYPMNIYGTFTAPDTLKVLSCNSLTQKKPPKLDKILPNLEQLSLEVHNPCHAIGLGFYSVNKLHIKGLKDTLMHTPYVEKLTLRRWNFKRNTLSVIGKHLTCLHYLDISKACVHWRDLIGCLKCIADHNAATIDTYPFTIHAWCTAFKAPSGRLVDVNRKQLEAIFPCMKFVADGDSIPEYRYKHHVGEVIGQRYSKSLVGGSATDDEDEADTLRVIMTKKGYMIK